MDNRANISKAIARSRGMRRAMHRRRRRLVLAACLATAAGAPFSLSLVGVSGNDMVHAAVNGASSLADLFDKRSPGERTAAQLTKTKHAKRPTSAMAPPDRRPIAPTLMGRHHFDEVADILVGAPPPTVEIAPPVQEASIDIPTIAGLIGSSPDVVGTPSGGGDGGSGGGGGGSSTFPASEPHQPLTPVAAVPEPGTWATMLLGFAMLGWRMRRRPSKHAVRKAAA